jgi:hypothetical protein
MPRGRTGPSVADRTSVPETRRAGITAVAMDMWEPDVQSSRAHLPGADDKIVLDKFHVVKDLHDAVDQVRRGEHRALKRTDDDRLTGSKYLWLRRPEDMTEEQCTAFRALQHEDLVELRARRHGVRGTPGAALGDDRGDVLVGRRWPPPLHALGNGGTDVAGDRLPVHSRRPGDRPDRPPRQATTLGPGGLRVELRPSAFGVSDDKDQPDNGQGDGKRCEAAEREHRLPWVLTDSGLRHVRHQICGDAAQDNQRVPDETVAKPALPTASRATQGAGHGAPPRGSGPGGKRAGQAAVLRTGVTCSETIRARLRDEAERDIRAATRASADRPGHTGPWLKARRTTRCRPSESAPGLLDHLDDRGLPGRVHALLDGEALGRRGEGPDVGGAQLVRRDEGVESGVVALDLGDAPGGRFSGLSGLRGRRFGALRVLPGDACGLNLFERVSRCADGVWVATVADGCDGGFSADPVFR